MDRASRLLGLAGTLFTLLISLLAPLDTFNWQYSIDTYDWKPHLFLLIQYLYCGTAVVSIILFFKTFQFPLFPFGHNSSSLATYEWHWVFADFLAWGKIPFTGIFIFKTSLVQYMFTRMTPLPAILGIHLVCYIVCAAVGSRCAWKCVLRHLCYPQWIAPWIFPKASPDEPRLLPN